MKILLFAILSGMIACVSCSKTHTITAPDSVFPGKGFKREDGSINRVTLCKKHKVPVKVIDGYRYIGLMTGSPWFEEAVIDSPNIVGPSFSRKKSENYSIPAKAFHCPSCYTEFRKVKQRY